MDTAAERGPLRSPHAPGPPVSPRGTEEPGASHEASFLEPLERAFASLRRMASSYALLAILDVRRAAVQLAWLVGAGILVAVLVVTAWLAGVVALAAWLLGQGMSWPAVLAMAAALNLVAAGLVVWRIKDVFEQAPFTATVRQIKGQSSER